MRAEVGLYGRSPEELAVATWDRTAELVLFRVDALVLAVVAHPAEELLAVLALSAWMMERASSMRMMQIVYVYRRAVQRPARGRGLAAMREAEPCWYRYE